LNIGIRDAGLEIERMVDVILAIALMSTFAIPVETLINRK
jgi:hypothetical protein